MIPDDQRSRDDAEELRVGEVANTSTPNTDFESLILTVESALLDGIAAEIPDCADLPTELVIPFRETADCLALLHAAARAGQLNELADRELRDLTAASAADPAFEKVGRFEIVQELGRGGYGLVFLAVDPALGRNVALKVPRPEVLVTEELRRRFVREAEAAGGLQHRNLITVFEAGEVGPLCYLATAYCPGPTLAEWRRRRGGIVEARAAATLIAELTDGVAHAHARGVLHRDIKPSNVLLEPHGDRQSAESDAVEELLAYTPKLTDFGLAKLLERQDDETRTGTVLGTPAYMAPEQAAGRLGDICAATDVYGLGVLLYELLVGHPPFRGENDPDTLRRLCSDEPTPPSRVRSELPADLEAILLRCLEKSPSMRYQSAVELATDLRRYLAGEPTQARPLNWPQRAQRWVRRRPLVAGLLGVIAVGALALIVLTGWYTARLGAALTQSQLQRAEIEAERREAERERAVAEESQRLAERSQTESRQLLYAADIRLADEAFRSGNLQETLERLKRHLPTDQETKAAGDLREFGWYYLWHRCQNPLLTLRGHSGPVFSVCYAPSGAHVATGGKDGKIRVWDCHTGRPLLELAGHQGDVNQVTYSPDGKLLASVGADGTIKIWDVSTGKLAHIVLESSDEKFAVKFSSQGHLLAAGGKDGKVRIWRTEDWTPAATLDGHWDFVESLDFAPDDSALASAGADSQVILWDLASMTLRRKLEGRCAAIYAVRFSPRGGRLAAGAQTGEMILWDVSSGEELRRTQAHENRVSSLAFSPDGTRILTGSRDASARLWDVATGQQIAAFDGHAERLWQVAFDPQGSSFATASADGTAKLCKVSDPYEILPQYSIDRGQLALDSSGRLHAVSRTGSDGRGLAIYQGNQRQEWRPSDHSSPVVLSLSLDPTGTVAVGYNVAGEVYLRTQDGAWKRILNHIYHEPIWPPAISPGGRWLAIGWHNLRLHDLQSDGPTPEVRLPASARSVEFSSDGSRLAAALMNGRVAVWTVNKDEPVHLLPDAHGRVEQVCFSPDGGRLAVASEDGHVRIVNLADDSLLADLPIQAVEPTSLAFSPDGINLATAGANSIYISDTRTGQNLLVLDQLNHAAFSLVFGPSSEELLCYLMDQNVIRWTGPRASRVVTRAAPEDVLLRSNTAPPNDIQALPRGAARRIDSISRVLASFAELSGKRRALILPTFDDREDNSGLQLGTLTFLKGQVATAHYTDAATIESFELLARDADEYARKEKGQAAYPLLSAQKPTEVIFFEPGTFERRQLPASELGDIDSPRDRFRETHRWAKAHGYAGGFPNFCDAETDGEMRYGAILIKVGCGEEVFLPASTIWPATKGG